MASDWRNNSYDLDRKAMGNIFPTEAEAIAKRDKILAAERVNTVIREQFPFEADWTDAGQDKGILYAEKSRLIRVLEQYDCNPCGPIIPFNPLDFDAIMAVCGDDVRAAFGVEGEK